jgi:metal-responsive CopG/Arc/MetJ family transcriptional regulator
MSERKQMKRGAGRNSDRIFVGAWLPTAMVEALDAAVTQQDSDRSKFIREALKDKVKKEELVK